MLSGKDLTLHSLITGIEKRDRWLPSLNIRQLVLQCRQEAYESCYLINEARLDILSSESTVSMIEKNPHNYPEIHGGLINKVSLSFVRTSAAIMSFFWGIFICC